MLLTFNCGPFGTKGEAVTDKWVHILKTFKNNQKRGALKLDAQGGERQTNTTSKSTKYQSTYQQQVYREMVENGELESDVREAACRYKTQDLRRHLRHTLNNTLISMKS